MEKPSHEDGNCGFDILPPETHDKIFNLLDPSTLKSCRLVCSHWNSVLTYGQRRILTKGTFSVYRARNVHFTTWKYMKRYIQAKLFGVKVNESRFPFLLVNSLRITEVLLSDCSRLNHWINLYKLQNITCVELINCEMDVPTLVKILKLANLQELSLLDVEYLGLVDKQGYRDPSKASKIEKMQKSLKKLHMRERNLWKLDNSLLHIRPLSRFDVLSEALAQGTIHLEILKIECLGTGSYIDERKHFSDLFDTLHTFMKRNAASLKTLTLSTYDVENARRFNYINNQYWDLPRTGSDRVVLLFINQFRKNQTHLIELPNLEKLSFEFRCVQDDHEFHETILPWIRGLKKLEKFQLSQIDAKPSFILGIRNQLSKNCHCEFKSLSRLDRPVRNIVPDFPCEPGTLQKELNRLNDHQNLPFPLPPPFRYLPPRRPRGVLGYNDSTVQIKTDKITWTHLYNMPIIKFCPQQQMSLKEIRIQQYGICEVEKFKITDMELQTICTNYLELTHLEFEFCNLSEVSDFGLTGISPTACARMMANNDYNVKPEDVIGLSLSRLQELRVLKLSFVGNGVTNVTAHHLCRRFPHRLNGGIYGEHKMTEDGIHVLSKFLR